MKRIVVIGGGVIGTACAHYLHRAGFAVTLLDRSTIGGGCSHANCGYICPSHVLPLAGPGALQSTLLTLLHKNSPLKIRLRFDPTLWSWLFRFARRCNRRDMLEAAVGIQAMLNSSRSLYDELFRDGQIEAEWEERGLLFVFQTAHAMDHYAHTDKLLRERFNAGAVRYEGKALEQLEPALKPGLAGAWHYEADGHLRADVLMRSWRKDLESHGVEIREGCQFLGFAGSGMSMRTVQTSQGDIAANAAVVATGAMTPLLEKHLGCRVPIQPGKGYSITMARPKLCPTIPMIFEEHRVAITPMQSGYRIGSTMEFAGYDETLNRARLSILTEGAKHYLQEPLAEPIQEEWWGWRPMVYDGLPIIGPSAKYGNVLIAAGHGMLGLSMATGTGKLIAELLTGATPHVDPAPYSADRF